jgi:hypothetical protein
MGRVDWTGNGSIMHILALSFAFLAGIGDVLEMIPVG